MSGSTAHALSLFFLRKCNIYIYSLRVLPMYIIPPRPSHALHHHMLEVLILLPLPHMLGLQVCVTVPGFLCSF